MTILDVIRECVVALFKDAVLERTLVLKGGTALHLIEKIDSRLSTDIDFSACEKIASPALYFARVEDALRAHFSNHGYEVFDCKHSKKPQEKSAKYPEFWAGWSFEFKLVSYETTYENEEGKRRAALIPEGAASSRIFFDVSEHEYCASVQRVEISGSNVASYTGQLLVAEKIRAICQQHGAYPYGRKKNRARDYYDIYQLVRKYRSPEFYHELLAVIPLVFQAKQVDQALILRIFDPDFVAYQRSHFISVEASVSGKTEPFDFYAEQLKLLLSDIGLWDTLQMSYG